MKYWLAKRDPDFMAYQNPKINIKFSFKTEWLLRIPNPFQHVPEKTKQKKTHKKKRCTEVHRYYPTQPNLLGGSSQSVSGQ